MAIQPLVGADNLTVRILAKHSRRPSRKYYLRGLEGVQYAFKDCCSWYYDVPHPRWQLHSLTKVMGQNKQNKQRGDYHPPVRFPRPYSMLQKPSVLKIEH